MFLLLFSVLVSLLFAIIVLIPAAWTALVRWNAPALPERQVKKACGATALVTVSVSIATVWLGEGWSLPGLALATLAGGVAGALVNRSATALCALRGGVGWVRCIGVSDSYLVGCAMAAAISDSWSGRFRLPCRSRVWPVDFARYHAWCFYCEADRRYPRWDSYHWLLGDRTGVSRWGDDDRQRIVHSESGRWSNRTYGSAERYWRNL